MKKFALLLLMLALPFKVVGMSYIKRIFSSTSACDQTNKAHIKIIHLHGEINFHNSMIDLFDVAKNDQAHGVLLIIDNYGGRTANYFMLHDLIKKIGTIKPVVAFVSGAALSCGYALASAAHYIVAGNFSELGNIGVVSEFWKYKESTISVVDGSNTTNAKLEVELFSTGEFKNLANPYRALTSSEKLYLQESVNKTYQSFLATIAINRNLNLNDYKLWAEGKIFLAPEALQLGLIDEVGTMLEAENKLLELISQKNPGIICNQEIYYITA